MTRVVAIGGGHGLARALEALRLLDIAPTAIVTVADDGGSSGRLRRDLGIIAPGDLRMALLTLARNRDLADVLAHRFLRGELEGHAVGNLVLVALAELSGGDFVQALDRAADLLHCGGRVLPATQVPVQLKAVVGGRELDGQVQVATAPGHIEALWLEPADPPACEDAVAAIREAEVVVLGPGSLFTSVTATLLVPGIAEALVSSPARRVYVGNLLAQRGETTGMDAQAHVDALLERVDRLVLDVVLIHDAPPVDGFLGDVQPGERVGTVVRKDLVGPNPAAGHDAHKLAAALGPVLHPP